MKIINLKSENVKRLQAVEITPDGNLVVIGGRNSQGKSSVLDSVLYALAGKREIPERPVRNGQEEAEIEVRLEACPERGITDELIVRRVLTADGKARLDIRSASDNRPYNSPQALLDSLTGRVGFDPLAFMRLKPAEQAEQLSAIVGVSFEELDGERATAYQERHALNKQAAAAMVKAEAMPHYPDAEPVDTSALMEELRRRREVSRQADLLQQHAEAMESRLEHDRQARIDADDEVTRLNKLLFEAKRAAKEALAAERECEGLLEKAKREAAEAPRENLAEIEQQITDASRRNAACKDNAARETAIDHAKELQAEAEALTDRIEEIDATKARLMAEAAWPIPGLGFGAHGVTLNNLPFEQASSSEQLAVSVAVGAALNPACRVLLIRDGSLLDVDSLRVVGELAEKYDCQVWIERVSDGEECLVVVEDGAVVRRRSKKTEAAGV